MQTMEQPAHRIEEASAPLWFGSGPTAWGDVVQAVENYCREVREGAFPAAEHGFR